MEEAIGTIEHQARLLEVFIQHALEKSRKVRYIVKFMLLLVLKP